MVEEALANSCRLAQIIKIFETLPQRSTSV